jgi:NitT/TauT family transport system substrate-binding protein
MRLAYAPRHKRRFLIALAAVFAALAAAAFFFINGDWGIKPLGQPEKVTIAYATLTDAALPIVAQMRGYSFEEGLEVTPRLHPYGKLALQDVLEGKADFATAAETPVMFAIMNGEKVAIIATIETTNQVNAIVARKDRGINALEDLRGRKIAVTLGTDHGLFLRCHPGYAGHFPEGCYLCRPDGGENARGPGPGRCRCRFHAPPL